MDNSVIWSTGWLQLRARIFDFIDREQNDVFEGFGCRPTISQSFSTKEGSLESLNPFRGSGMAKAWKISRTQILSDKITRTTLDCSPYCVVGDASCIEPFPPNKTYTSCNRCNNESAMKFKSKG